MASQRISRAEVNPSSVPTRSHRALICSVMAAAFLAANPSDVFASGSISGNVKSSVTNQVPAGAKVQFYDLNGNSDGPVATAIADGNGNYTQNLPDSIYAAITQNSAGLINKIWSNIPCSAVCDIGQDAA